MIKILNKNTAMHKDAEGMCTFFSQISVAPHYYQRSYYIIDKDGKLLQEDTGSLPEANKMVFYELKDALHLM